MSMGDPSTPLLEYLILKPKGIGCETNLIDNTIYPPWKIPFLKFLSSAYRPCLCLFQSNLLSI